MSVNIRHVYTSSHKFVKEERSEIITTSIIFTLFQISQYFIENFAYRYQDLAVYMPALVVIIPVILFGIRYPMLYKKLAKTKTWQTKQALKDRHYRSKIIIIAFNASTFLYADIVVVFALAMSYFAFAFNAGTGSFYETWHQLHLADVSFLLLSAFTLICMRRK